MKTWQMKSNENKKFITYDNVENGDQQDEGKNILFQINRLII